MIVAHPGTLVTLNPRCVRDTTVFVTETRRRAANSRRGGASSSDCAAAITEDALGKIHYSGIFGLPQIDTPAAFRLDIATALQPRWLPFVAVFLFMNIFDTLGSVIGVTQQAGLMKDGTLPRAERVLVVDAAGTVAAAAIGTSTIVTYIESAAGVSAGGRTGLTAIVAGLLFFVARYSARSSHDRNYLQLLRRR